MNSTKPSHSVSRSRIAQQHRYARYQRGASLLEGIAYLGIAAIVVLGAVSLLTGAFSSAKSNQATEEVVALRTAVRKLYLGQAYASGADLLPTLILANAVPNTLAKTGNTLTNSWGGAVTVAGTGTGFNVTYNGVPQDVCVNVLSGANGWSKIVAGATTLDAFPVTVALAGTSCAAGVNVLQFIAA